MSLVGCAAKLQIFGQLSTVHSVCVARSAFARTAKPARPGNKHLSYVLYGKLKGRRFTVYIPEDLVPEVRRCLDNGRALQQLLFDAAPRYIKALKRQESSKKLRG
jgi:hypothetical protein